MPGPAPKPAKLRARRNKKSGATKLRPAEVSMPELANPDGRTWHALTLEWWAKVWESPMANEYLPADVEGLARLAVLVDGYNSGKLDLAAEIRLQEARFGLSPLDRARLQWEMEKGEQAERKRTKPATKQPRKDPRNLLRFTS